MKNTVIFTLVGVILSGFVSCERDNGSVPCRATNWNDTAIFIGNQPSSLFNPCTTDLQGRVINLNDSRCPANAVCIWAGTIYADLELVDRFTVRLQQNVPKDTVYQGHQYSFTLTDASPYPGTGNSAEPKKAFVRIVRN